MNEEADVFGKKSMKKLNLVGRVCTKPLKLQLNQFWYHCTDWIFHLGVNVLIEFFILGSMN